MESKKSRRLSWLDCFLGPKNSNSKWLQENLQEINENVVRKLKIIEDSDAESIKVEMYNESRQEINKLVDKCCATLIPSSQGISSNVCESRRRLSKLHSSKHRNAAECSVVSKQLQRGLSEKESKINIRKKRSAVHEKIAEYYSSDDDDDGEAYDDDDGEAYDELEADLGDMIEKLYIQMEWDRVVSMLQHRVLRYEDDMCDDDGELIYFVTKCAYVKQHIYYSDTESDDDDGKDYDELEADLRDMMEKLYIQMEWDRFVSIMLQHRILRPYEDEGQVKESNVDKALLEETLELHGEICRRLNEMSYLEEYNEQINATKLRISLFKFALSKCWCF